MTERTDPLRQPPGDESTGSCQDAADPSSLAQAALDAISALVLVIDSECRIIFANRQVRETTRCEQRELIGRRPGDALRCLGALDGSDGCGSGERCRSCSTRLAVFETLRDGVTVDRRPATLWIDAEARQIALSSTPLAINGERGAVVLLQEDSALAVAERERLQRQESRKTIEQATINAAMTSLAARLMIAQGPTEAARWTLEAAMSITGSCLGYIDVADDASDGLATAAVIDSRQLQAAEPTVDDWLAVVRGRARSAAGPFIHEADEAPDAGASRRSQPRVRSMVVPVMDGPRVIGEIGLAACAVHLGLPRRSQVRHR